MTESPDEYPSTSSTPIGRRGSYKNSRGWWWHYFFKLNLLNLVSRMRTTLIFFSSLHYNGVGFFTTSRQELYRNASLLTICKKLHARNFLSLHCKCFGKHGFWFLISYILKGIFTKNFGGSRPIFLLLDSSF